MCIVQLLQPMDSFGFQLVTDEFECPLFQHTHRIPSQCITTSVSFCHQCTSSCKFVCKSTTVSFERELNMISERPFPFTHAYISKRMRYTDAWGIKYHVRQGTGTVRGTYVPGRTGRVTRKWVWLHTEVSRSAQQRDRQHSAHGTNITAS